MITVRIISPLKVWVDLYGDEAGRVYFDLTEDFGLSLTKAIDRLGEFQSVAQEAALSSALPSTDRNRVILGAFGDPTGQPRTARLSIEVQHDGLNVPLTGCRASGYDPSTGTYEVEFFGADWVDDLEDFVLYDKDLGSFDYTPPNVLSAWETGDGLAIPFPAIYRPTPSPIVEFTMRDLRFWFNLYRLLREVFCQIGWEFDCPHLERGDGSTAVAYLSSDKWYSYPDKRAYGYAHMEINGPVEFSGLTEFLIPWEIVSDEYQVWNRQFTFLRDKLALITDPTDTPVTATIRLTVDVTLPPVNAFGQYGQFIAVLIKGIGEEEIFLLEQSFPGHPTDTVRRTFEVEYVDENGGNLNTYYWVFYYDGPYTVHRMDWRLEPDPAYLQENDVIPVARSIDPELTGMDVLMGAAHLFNAKFVTDYSTKTVRMMPPHDYTAQRTGEVIEGFYRRASGPSDWRARTVPGSTKWDSKILKRNRYRVYKFAEGDDARVEALGAGLFDRRIDLGEGVNDEDEIENPLFEATYRDRVQYVGVTETVTLPSLAKSAEASDDGDDDREALGFRVVNFYGFVPVGDDALRFFGGRFNRIPYLAQGVSRAEGVASTPLSFRGSAFDIYERHYRREVGQDADPVTYELFLTGGDRSYAEIDFRNSLIVRGEFGDWEFQPTAVKDHRLGSEVPLLVTGKQIKC